MESIPPRSLDQLPPPSIVQSLIDTFFARAHNQPYSFFHPASFRQSIDDDTVPRCLLFAVLAIAVRYSTHPAFVGRTYEASKAYSKRSWLYALEDHLATDDNSDLTFVQAVAILAIIDFTAGKVSSGWLRLGLAIRLSQDLHLTSEPPPYLPNEKKEEQRRTFWSIYLLDKLMSCARSKPAALLDQDCTVQLPCDEATFRNMEHKQTPTLQQMLSWDSDIEEPPSLFSLTIATSSIFARCTRYARGQTTADSLPPWDPQSEFTATNASLLFVESYLKRGPSSILNLITNGASEDDNLDVDQLWHLILAHSLFHLCHCLLNHPFLMRLRLRPVTAKAPSRFASGSFQLCQDHARKLTDMLAAAAAAESKLFIKSSFYTYCAAISAGVHCLASSAQQQGVEGVDYDARRYFERSVHALEKLAVIWPMVAEMVKKVTEFGAEASAYASLFDVKCLADTMDSATENTLWTLIDYGLLAKETPGKSPGPISFLSNLPSPSTWSYPMDEFATGSDLCTTATENQMLFLGVDGSQTGY
ncbi:fungal-specific transcription factor domain-containing protein [Thelonectria olida]|uniref:Fungal-specific transcription factor domain-containing protein n=1 Tax=Thelonectria olida TaxID=1576542 RepID=A0A9P9AQE2_9HYPO|nr:fungal-specific transcription factor domain-containing protein [Thelonectria olida]